MSLANSSVQPRPQSSTPFIELLDEYSYRPPKPGEYIDGEVIRVTDDALFFDIGAKRDAIAPYNDFGDLDASFLDGLSRGDVIPVYVKDVPRANGELRVSVRKGLERQDWRRAEEMEKSGELLDVTINAYNKGGVVASFGRIDGFVPNSHLVNVNTNSQSEKAKMVGESIPVTVLEVDMQRHRLVLSMRAAQRELALKRILELEIGSVMSGRVANVVKYGAFVDLGGITGLVHRSVLAWRSFDHPREVVQTGDTIEVLIEDIDVERRRVRLNHRACLPNPYVTFAERHKVGDRIAGRVANVTDFGVFVELVDGVEGLVHVSELETWRTADLHEAFNKGDDLLVAIVRMDPESERIGLSRRAVSYEEELEWMQSQQQESADVVDSAEAEAEAEAEAPVDEIEETEPVEPVADQAAEDDDPVAEAELAPVE